MSDIGRAIGDMIAFLFIMCVIFVPLGAWKLIEIIVWLYHHIRWSVA